MADFSGSVWHFFPGDAPGQIGYDNTWPAGYTGIKRIVWRNQTDNPMPTGSVAHIRDANFNDVFKRVWPPDSDLDTNEVILEVDGVYRGLYVEALEAGVLDIYVM